MLHLEHDWTVYFSYSIISILLCLVKLFVVFILLPFGAGCWRKMLSISWQEHHTNDSILTELDLERELMGRAAKLKLQYFGHITRESAEQLALERIMKGLRHQGRSRRQWIHVIESTTKNLVVYV